MTTLNDGSPSLRFENSHLIRKQLTNRKHKHSKALKAHNGLENSKDIKDTKEIDP